ncbi:hypothetical protein ABT009_23720 [Streptomyces sp. NPDC002896]|uniref:hypothetical protein n=1 Tax=Streptomyces sp. NPDC002896 TaxID=3154438 RepID=UPI00332267D9
MPHRQGDRVEYRDEMNQKQTGVIQDVQGSGQQARYTVENLETQRQEQVREQQIERDLD